MLKRKLLKRALPLLLSVSMVFGSMPETVLAAEYEESASVEETVLGESEAANENEAESSDNTPETTGGEVSEETGGSVVSETSETSTTQPAEAGSVDANDDNKVETETVAETKNAAETAVETQNAAETETAAEVTEAAEMNEAAALVTEITTKNVEKHACQSPYNFTYEDGVVTGVYNKGTAVFDSFVNDVIKSNSEEVKDVVQVKVDGEVKDNLKANLTYKWTKANAEGAYVDLAAGETPTDAGLYRLEISLEAIDNVCTATSAVIDFKIEQIELTITVDSFKAEIGQTLTAYAEKIKKDYKLQDKNNTGYYDKDTLVKSFVVTIVDAVTGVACDANAVFEQGKDYAYTISAELNDANYKLAETEQTVINFSDPIPVKMEVTLPKLIEYTYTGEKIALPVAGTDYTVKVTYDIKEDGEAAGPGEEAVETKEIENPVIKAEWADADGNKLEEGDAPVNAGSYKLVLTFTDETGRYEETEDSINVTVKPVSVYVKPSLTTAEYPSGVSESEILKNVDYEVLTTEKNEAPKNFDKQTFWGVSYNNPDKTQMYTPVFTLQVSELMLDEEGKPVKGEDGTPKYSDYTDNDGAELIADATDGHKNALYRVVFSGKKAVYTENGSAVTVDVNDHGTDGADTNCRIDLSADTISKYAAEVKVTEAKLVTINTDAYANDVKTKVYDGEPFYAKRADYKKATAEGGTLTYQWFEAEKVVTTDKDGNETVEYELGDEVFDWNITDINEQKYFGVSPSEVGKYMLVISYDDPTGETVAKPAQVGPYVIDLQKVQADLSLAEGAALVSYTGSGISSFLEKCESGTDILNVVKPIVNNVFEPITLGEPLEWMQGLDYEIEYVVERKNNLTGEWIEAQGTFEENCEYRLRAEVHIKNEVLKKYYQSYEQNKDKKPEFYLSNALDIDVKKMGAAKVFIEIDASKFTERVKKYDAQPFAIPEGAVTVTAVKDGADVTGEVELTYQWYDKTASEYLPQAEAVNCGEYDLRVGFAGNEKYAALETNEEKIVTDFEITKRSVTLKPVVKETVAAGTKADYKNVVVGYSISGDSDILESERPFFDGIAIEGISLAAIDSTDGYIYESDGKTKALHGVLKGSKTYYAVAVPEKVTFNEILDEAFSFSRNYEIKSEKTEVIPVRGNAVIAGYGASIKDYVTEMTHTIVPKEGVPYFYNNDIMDEEDNPLTGNLLVFTVKAPLEYFKNGNREDGLVPSAADGFVYENSLKKDDVGGYVVEDITDSGNGSFTVAIPITKEDVEGGKTKSFDVRWENGYVETITVNCKDVVLEDDLTKAVAPKSLAFNSPVTKMIVGEKQQLDVKVTKANIDDIVYLKYQTADTTVLSVTEDTGAVVALSKGTATVEAIPCYLDENGEKQELPDAKHATVKITVNDVTAPKIKSVTAYDTYADVTYPAVSDGYRREIYVLEGNQKEDAFTDAFTKFKNGDWKAAGFATNPVFDTHASAEKGAMTTVRITGLKPGTAQAAQEYTVYVRNVSGIRTLADGTPIAASAAGSVKSFKMTLPQVKGLGIAFPKDYYQSEVDEFMVPLSDKNVTAVATGFYEEIYTDGTVNTEDWKEYTLPLDKELAKTYMQPKLNFYVSKYYDPDYDEIDVDHIDSTWSAATDIAKIDKKGKLTLTGVGLVYVLVTDTVTKEYAVGRFIITATADRMEIAKSVKLKVGQKADLFDLLTYYEGKTKLTGYVDYKLQLASLGIGTGLNLQYGTNGDKDGFIIASENIGIDDFLKRDYAGEVTAVKPDKTMVVAVKDTELAQDAVEITFTSSAIDPVKNLKTTIVTDKYATISFTYPLYDMDWEWDNYSETESSNQVYFRIQVKNANDRIVYDRYCNMFDDFYYDVDNKKNTVTLSTTLGGLTRKSSYTVSVTACYLDEKSKEAAKSIKTTDIPAAYPGEQGGSFYAYSKLPDSDYMTADGGIEVLIGNNVPLSDYAYPLNSNNTYTLVAWPDNIEAMNRLSDTLTWKSTNTKVASVKANAGTYTATLKTLRKGTTKIELSSKLTKRIIARWTVIVNATGGADYFFGDWEPDEKDGVVGGGFDGGELQLLTVDNPVRATLAGGEALRAKFTAPAYGKYVFAADTAMRVYHTKEKQWGGFEYSHSEKLNQGETCYFIVPNFTNKTETFTLEVSDESIIYQAMDMSGITLTERATVVFTAPEDNYYTLYRNGARYEDIGGLKQGDPKPLSLPAGIYTVEKRTITGTLTTDGLKDISVPAETTYWYVFTAPEDMEYTFGKSSDALTMRFYDEIMDSGFDSAAKRQCEKGEKYYVAIVNNGDAEVKTDITVTPAAQVISASGSSELSLAEANKTVWAQLKIEEAGMYNVGITAAVKEDGTKPNLTVYKAASTNQESSANSEDDYTFDKGEIVYFGISSDQADTKVTVTVSKVTGTTQEKIEEGSKEANINADSYVFTAKTSDWYVFSADPIKVSETEEIPVYVRVYNAKGALLFDTGDPSRAANSGTHYLKEGDKVYVRYYTKTAVAETKATVKIEKDSAEVFTETWKGTLGAGEQKWLQFKAPADGYYIVTTEGAYPSKNLEGYYKQGETSDVYLRANADGECKITVSLITPTTLSDKEFELAAGETKLFKYTAGQDGSYQEAYTGNVSVTKYNSSFSNELLFGDTTMKAGDTYYYKVVNRSSETVKATLSVTQVTAEEMTLENSKKETELVSGEYTWYSFKASKPGWYRIEAENADVAYYLELGGSEKTKDPNLNVVYLAAKETVYAKVTCNTGTEKVKVTTTLTAMNPTDITPASADAPVEKKGEKIAAAGDINWYSISGEGTYTLTLSEKIGADYIRYAKNAESDFINGGDSVVLTLGTEDIYTIAVRADAADCSYTLKAEKRDVKQLSLTETVSAELKQGDELYVSFTVPETGRYAVVFDGLTDGATADMKANIERISGEVRHQQQTGPYWTFCSNVNEKLTFKINNVASETAVNLTVKAEAVKPVDITESGKATIDVNSVKPGYMSWYEFTAPENGLYVVKASEAAFIAQTDSLESGYLQIRREDAQSKTVSLLKDQAVYWAVWYDKKPSANVELSVSKLEIHELAVGQSLKMDTQDVVPGEPYRVSFTAPEDGVYAFLFAEEVDAEADAVASPLVRKYLCWREDSVSGSENDFHTNNVLKKGEKLIFDAKYTDKALKSCTISAVKQEITPVSAEGTELTLKAGEYKYVSITPQKDSNITVNIEAAEGIKHTPAKNNIYDLMDDRQFGHVNTSLEAAASVTNPAYIGFKAENDGTVKISYTEDSSLETLKIGENPVTVDSDKIMSFTADENAVYSFMSSSNEGFEIQAGDAYGHGRIYLRKGDTALVTIRSNGTDSRTIIVTKNTVTQMPLDAQKNIDLSNGTAYVEFDAEREGLYVFFSGIPNYQFVSIYKISDQASGWESVDGAFVKSAGGVMLEAGNYIAEISCEYEVGFVDYTISYYGRGIVVEDENTHFTVNRDEVVYVKPNVDGAMQFDIKADSSVRVEYLPTFSSEEILIGEGTEISTKRYFGEEELLSYFKITGTRNNTDVSFNYKWIEKFLLNGYNEIYDVDVEHADYPGYVDYIYLCEKAGDYNFDFYEKDENEGISKIEIYDAEDISTPLKTIDYSQDNIETCSMAYGREYIIRLYMPYDNGYIYIYPMITKYVDGGVLPYEYLVGYDAGKACFIFTAPESGMYKFYLTNADSNDVYKVAYLYDIENNKIAENDSGGDDFSIIQHGMSSGEVVYLQTQAEGDASYYVHIDKDNGDNTKE